MCTITKLSIFRLNGSSKCKKFYIVNNKMLKNKKTGWLCCHPVDYTQCVVQMFLSQHKTSFGIVFGRTALMP